MLSSWINNSVVNQKGNPAMMQDIFSNRPQPGVVGRLFVSTDTLKIYRDTGIAWVEVNAGGGGGIGGSGAATQIPFFTDANTVSGSNDLEYLDGILKLISNIGSNYSGLNLVGLEGQEFKLYRDGEFVYYTYNVIVNAGVWTYANDGYAIIKQIVGVDGIDEMVIYPSGLAGNVLGAPNLCYTTSFNNGFTFSKLGTQGMAESVYGDFPALSLVPVTNLSSVFLQNSCITRVGGTVKIDIAYTVTPVVASNLTEFSFTVPVLPNTTFGSSYQIIGAGSLSGGASINRGNSCCAVAIPGTNDCLVRNSAQLNNDPVKDYNISLTYHI